MKKTLPDPSTMPKVECSCDKCKGCCEGSPGWFLPGEAEKAAALLGIPYGEFRKSLIVDYWITSDGEQDVLTPRKQGLEMNRKRASWGYAFQSAPCVFLTEDKQCRIHAAKPYECAVAKACDEGASTNHVREWIQAQWAH